MIVETSLLMHPKFIALRERLGDQALYVLLRIWGHCQQDKRGEFWPGATPVYVEMVANWHRRKGVCYQALVDLKWLEPDSKEVRVDSKGIRVEMRGFRVHGWNETNASLIQRWNANPRGRSKSKKINGRSESTDYPTGQPKPSSTDYPTGQPAGPADDTSADEATGQDRTGQDRTACPPTPQGVAAHAVAESVHPGDVPDPAAVLAFAAAWPGEPTSATPGPIPADYVTAWMARREMSATGFGRHWQRLLVSCWRADWRRYQADHAARSKPYAPLALPAPPDPSWPEDLDDLAALIEAYKADDPAKANALRRWRAQVIEARQAQGRSVPT